MIRVLPQLIPSMEKHGYLSLNSALLEWFMKVRWPPLKEAHTSAVKNATGWLTASAKVSRSGCLPGRCMERDFVACCGWHLCVDAVANR